MPDPTTISQARLVLLGQPTLVLASGDFGFLPRRAFLLAALLLLEFGGTAPRSLLAARLWEEADDKRAQNLLRQLLSRIRQIEAEHGIALFAVTPQTVTLHSAIESDLGRLLTDPVVFMKRNYPAHDPAKLLFGLKVEGDLNSWIEAARDRLVDKVVTATLAAKPAEARNALEPDLRRLAELAPLNEGVLLAQMQTLFADGRVAEASHAYWEFSRRMREELGVEPSEQIRHALETGRQGYAEKVISSGVQNDRVPRLILLAPTFSQIGAHSHVARLAETLVADVTVALSRLHTVAVIAPQTGRLFSKSLDQAPWSATAVDFVLRTRLATPFVSNTPHLGFYLELIRTMDEQLVWAERLDFSPDLSAERYEDMIRLIVDQVAGRAEQDRQIGGNPSAHPRAYQTYLLGQRQLDTLHLPSVRRARKLFRSAQEAAPQHAETASSLARTYIVEWVLRNGNDDALLTQAETVAQRAANLDPEGALGQRELGLTALYRGRYDDCLEHFRIAEAGTPHHADMIADHADALVHCSEPAAAAANIERALDLNPAAPDSYLWTAGGANYLLGRFDTALTYLARMQNMEPALKLAAASAAMAGELSVAHRLRDRELEVRPDFRISDWMATMPMRDPQHVRQYAEGLLAAGFQ